MTNEPESPGKLITALKLIRDIVVGIGLIFSIAHSIKTQNNSAAVDQNIGYALQSLQIQVNQGPHDE